MPLTCRRHHKLHQFPYSQQCLYRFFLVRYSIPCPSCHPFLENWFLVTLVLALLIFQNLHTRIYSGCEAWSLVAFPCSRLSHEPYSCHLSSNGWGMTDGIAWRPIKCQFLIGCFIVFTVDFIHVCNPAYLIPSWFFQVWILAWILTWKLWNSQWKGKIQSLLIT